MPAHKLDGTYLLMKHTTSWPAVLLAMTSLFSAACANSHASVDSGRVPEDAGTDANELVADAACDGPELPAVLVGDFWVTGEACSVLDPAAPPFAVFWIASCGDAGSFVPDGINTSGMVRATQDGFAYAASDRTPGITFRITPLVDERGGGPVLRLSSIDDAIPWTAWAIRRPGFSSAAAPHIEVCGTNETWSMHALEGATTGSALESGDGSLLAPTPRIALGGDLLGESTLFQIFDPSPSWGLSGPVYFRITEWSGSGGRASLDYGSSLCVESDGGVDFSWDGARLVLEADWVLIDAADIDGDGSTSDWLVRRTRTEFTSEACR